MQKKIKKLLKSLKRNDGATLSTVVVTSFFLISLAVAILQMAYTGYLLKATEHAGIQGFYTATSPLNDIKSALTILLSDSIDDVYEDRYTNFLEPMEDNRGNLMDFEEAVYNTMRTKTTADLGSSKQLTIIQKGTSGGYYNVQALAECYILAGGDENDIYIEGVTSLESKDLKTIQFGSSANASWAFKSAGIYTDDEENMIILKDISVTYFDTDRQRQVNVTTDIVIEIPDYPDSVLSGGEYQTEGHYDPITKDISEYVYFKNFTKS